MGKYRAIVSFCPSLDVESFLSLLPSGQRSRWINECLEQHIGELNTRVDLDMWEAMLDEIEALEYVSYSNMYDFSEPTEIGGETVKTLNDFSDNEDEPHLERGDTLYILYKRQFARREFVDTQEEVEACDWIADYYGKKHYWLDENNWED